MSSGITEFFIIAGIFLLVIIIDITNYGLYVHFYDIMAIFKFDNPVSTDYNVEHNNSADIGNEENQKKFSVRIIQ